MTDPIASRPFHDDSIVQGEEEPPSKEYNLFFDDLENVLNSLLGDALSLQGFTYTVATVPDASANQGGLIFVSDGSLNRSLATSDGTNWRFADGAIIS